MSPSPYCGAPPLPAELLGRFNLDPLLIVLILAVSLAHFFRAPDPRARKHAAAGWLVAAIAFISPLCALSVSLFAARVAQHMVLLLIAAPLIALGWPAAIRRNPGLCLWAAAGAFFLALWVWHMPVPYDATFESSTTYWAMHVTLFGSGILLWRELLHHARYRTSGVVMAGMISSMHMSLLGAVLSFASHPLFGWHLTTTAAWGLSPLEDQQLGGVFMWVPGIVLFLWVAVRSLHRLWREIERIYPA